jgi:hypothetical protein
MTVRHTFQGPNYRADLDAVSAVGITDRTVNLWAAHPFQQVIDLEVQIEFPDDLAKRVQELERIWGGSGSALIDSRALGWTGGEPADPSHQYVVMNIDRWVEMTETERSFTIGHELGHAYINCRRRVPRPAGFNAIVVMDEYRATSMAVEALLPAGRELTEDDFPVWVNGTLNSWLAISWEWSLAPEGWFRSAAVVAQHLPLMQRLGSRVGDSELWQGFSAVMRAHHRPDFLGDVDTDDMKAAQLISSCYPAFAKAVREELAKDLLGE